MPSQPPPSLLTDIEQDLLAGVAVADLLRKLIILGGRSGSEELRGWAGLELRGYADVIVDDLPAYRRIPAIIQLDAVTPAGTVKHQTIGPKELPEPAREHIDNLVPFFQGVGEIQALAAAHQGDGTVRIALPGEREIARLIDSASGNPYQRITALYWSVSTSALEGLIDQVRTRLAELLGELRAGTPASLDAPTAAQANHAVNVVIRGRGNRVQLGQVSQGTGNVASVETAPHTPIDRAEPPEQGFWTLGKKIGGIAVGIATIAAAIIAWWQLQLTV